ncbi:MAG TPA: DUF58 domain-containing protein [Planctomycetota bacterium]|nr:DUF58 domain-containing protein [Planctomycetota bacterium]
MAEETARPPGLPSDAPAAERPERRKGRFRLNGRGWIYLILAVSVAFAAAFKGNNLLFAIFCVLFGLFAVCGVLTVVTARGLQLSRVVPDAAAIGEAFPVAVRLRNAKRLWPAVCLRIDDRLTHEGRPALQAPSPVWVPYAGPRQRVRGTSWVTAHERGWARLGPFTVTSEFIPGLFTYRLEIPGEDRLLVTPRLGRLQRRLVSNLLARAEDAMAATMETAPGQDDYCGLRDYRSGDPLRRIDWKMSARMPSGRLLVREYDDPKSRSAVLLLDTFLPGAGDARRRQRLERAVTFAATLADHLLAEQYTVGFRAFGPDPVSLELEPRRGAIDDLLLALALVKPSRTRPLSELVAAEAPAPDRVYFLLRAGDDPLPGWEPLGHRAVVVDAVEMRQMLHEPA